MRSFRSWILPVFHKTACWVSQSASLEVPTICPLRIDAKGCAGTAKVPQVRHYTSSPKKRVPSFITREICSSHDCTVIVDPQPNPLLRTPRVPPKEPRSSMCPSRHKNGSNVGIPVVSFGMSLDASALSELQDSPELRHGTFTERTEWCGKSVAR